MSNLYLEKISGEAEATPKKGPSKLLAAGAGIVGGVAGALAGRSLGAKAGMQLAGRNLKKFLATKQNASLTEKMVHASKGYANAHKTVLTSTNSGIIAGGLAGGAGGRAIANKYSGQEKKAALEQLMESGMDFDSAIVAIEKEAGIIGSALGAAKGLVSKIVASPVTGAAVNMAIKNPMRTAMGVGALATGAGALMARGSKEKQACIKQLVDQGIDFEQAVEMTKQASIELYGE